MLIKYLSIYGLMISNLALLLVVSEVAVRQARHAVTGLRGSK